LILRNIALGLLLANLLLLAWKSWVVPPDLVNPARMSAGEGAQLVLVNRATGAEEAAAPGTAASAAMDASATSSAAGRGNQMQCTRIGPFSEVDVADSVSQQLKAADFVVSRTSKVGEIWVGYWVQLVDLKTAAKAAAMVDRLINAGLVDAYVFQSEPTISISLGVFRSRKGADRVAGMARDMGLRPETTDRFHPGVEHWLTVKIQNSRKFSLSDIKIATNSILRTESLPCEADAVVDYVPIT
jgi:hypothetical protein